jgi:hypothetical protein
MKRVLLLVMAVTMLAGTWQASQAQTSKSTTQKKNATAKVTKPATPVAVQTAAPVETATAPEPVADSAPVVDSTTPDTAHAHHKKGLFGKAKSVMSNKVVKAVVKTAACTMVPGGQAIAGAIDAASSKSAGEAAQGAAGVATGTSCMPGMGGIGGAGMTGAGMAGSAGLARAGMSGGGVAAGAGLASLAGAGLAGAAASRSSGYPQGAAPNGMAMAGGYGMMSDPKPMADCMGLTVEEYNALINPTNGEPRAVTKAEMKRMQQVSKKVGAQRQMMCSQTVGMQQAHAQAAQMQQVMAQAQTNMAARTAAATGPSGAAMTEAPGHGVELASDLGAELKKGKTAVRGIDWVAGSAEVSSAGRQGFDEAMATLGAAIKQSGQHYRLDLYMDQRYDDAAVSTFGPARLQAVQSALAGAIGDPNAAQIGKTKRDKNTRLELVKVK